MRHPQSNRPEKPRGDDFLTLRGFGPDIVTRYMASRKVQLLAFEWTTSAGSAPVYGGGVSDDSPLVQLPDEIILSREAGVLLFALDVSRPQPTRGAIRLVTSKLWARARPALG